MDFRDHRPHRRLGHSERPLVKIATDLTRFFTKAQRSLTYETLHLSGRQRETLASILVEFAEDLYQDVGIWRSLEAYNRDFFGTPLPCILSPDEAMDADPVHPARVQFLLWTLYSVLEPDLLLAPNHQDLERLAIWMAEFLSARFARMRYDSGVKTFLTTPNQYGWDVKRKLVWLGQHSYLFRLHCEQYIRDQGGQADIPTLDDFVCQETTHWSGLGVIDILAATLDITDSQRHDLRRWYERHTAYFRVVSLREPFMDVINLLNDQPYTIHVGKIDDQFRVHDVVFGSLVPWDGVWYWSGVQHKYAQVTDEVLQQAKQDFSLKAPQIVYRYCGQLAEKARELVREHYQEFVDYYGKELVVYADERTFRHPNAAPEEHTIVFHRGKLVEIQCPKQSQSHDTTSSPTKSKPRTRRATTRGIPDKVKTDVAAIVEHFNTIALPNPHCVYVPRYKGKFLYLDRRDYGRLSPICRLEYMGKMEEWSFAIYKYSDERYDAEEWFFPGAEHVDGTIEGAMKAGLEAYPS